MQAGLTRIYLSKVTFLVRQLSCVFFCVVWFCLLLHLPSDWLGILTLVTSFVSKAFPYKNQIEELLIVMV